MFQFTLKHILALIALIGAALIFIFQQGLYLPAVVVTPNPIIENKEPGKNIAEESPNGDPKIISSNIDLNTETILLPNQSIELTFNYPLENTGEFKHRIDPKPKYKLILSDDKKTIKIMPEPIFDLGKSYTFFITPDTKFIGGKVLKGDIIFHFKTIEYKGV